MDIETQIEVERKYAVSETFAVPDLAGTGPVAAVDTPVEHTLNAVYFDTADLLLLGSKIVLRYRAGGTDAGWHVKRPATGGRRELRIPDRATGNPDPTAQQIPEVLLAEVANLVEREALLPVATINTRRTEHLLRDSAGNPLAVIADDVVQTSAIPPDPATGGRLSWHELEVELVDGPVSLFDVLEPQLFAAGASPANSPSKLARALSARRNPDPATEG